MHFETHHFTLSVRNIETSTAFYALFGFRRVFEWVAEDDSLTIVHLSAGDGIILEMFQYSSNRGVLPSQPAVGNDLEALGVKHIAFSVTDLDATFQEMEARQCGQMTRIQHGRTEIDYFFIADPDGNWVEVVKDDRMLS